MTSEPMEQEKVVELLNAALRLQARSALGFTLAAGSLSGFELAPLADRLWTFARAELEDTRRLVEKVTALGGAPGTEVVGIRPAGDPAAAIDRLIESETEAIEALHAVIPHSGQEGRSEALEHRIEHIIMRKQEQVDFLVRARRGTRGGSAG